MGGRPWSSTEQERVELATGWHAATMSANAAAEPDAALAMSPTWVAATAPSTIASVLRAAGAWSLDGPPRRFDGEDVWYRTRFDAAPARETDRVFLCFDGLATVADVWLNGEHVLFSESMFVAHEIEVSDRLRAQNELVLRFRALDGLLAVRRPRPRWRVPMIEHQQLRWFRTTLLGRTPGWSPPAAAVGPWRPVYLVRRRRDAAADVRVGARLEGTTGIVTVSFSSPSGAAEAELVLRRNGAEHRVRIARAPGADRWSGELRIDEVDRWWPHTHGEPALYEATIRLDATNEIRVGRIGFRDLRVDTDGRAFSIHVNGERIFCRGACWMPLDPVALGSVPSAYDAALQQVAACGMNMIRLSGTTVYEDDALFDACDRLGVLVWHDFMFANMDYPAEDERFGALVRREVEEVLSRLEARPSVAVFCGNSEGEQQAAMWGAPRELWSPRLFHETIARLVAEHCPGAAYWPSSAHGGAFPHQNDTGTTSYYGVGAYLRPLEDARRAEVRFATECLAFSNVPEPSSMLRMPGGESIRVHHPVWKARASRDLGAGWDFEDVRDHYLRELFAVDPSTVRGRDHERYLALSRVVTGEVMAAVFAEWRRARSTCAGGIVWFLRDLWDGAGWGIVDAGGSPKAPYYYLRRTLQPLHLSMSDEGTNGLYVHVANDAPAAVRGALEVSLYRDGEVLVAKGATDVAVGARGALEIPAATLFDGLFDVTYAYQFGPPTHDLVCATLRPTGGPRPVDAFYFPIGRRADPKNDLGLVATTTSVADGALDLAVRTRAFAMSVHIDADGYSPEDDYFHLAPGAERRVRLRPKETAKRSARVAVQALNATSSVKASPKE